MCQVVSSESELYDYRRASFAAAIATCSAASLAVSLPASFATSVAEEAAAAVALGRSLAKQAQGGAQAKTSSCTRHGRHLTFEVKET